jgi:hypothetical protein
MSNNIINKEHTQTDVILLKKIIDASQTEYAKHFDLPLNSLSPYVKSDLANSSRIFYEYLTKDSITDQEKIDAVSDSMVLKSAVLINEQYDSLVEYRSKSLSKGMHMYSEFSFGLEATLTFMIGLISPYSELNPAKTLLPDLFLKFFSQALGLLRMLNLDLASEAYSNWRTLHEAECVIKLLVEGGKPLQDVYLKHLVYNNAFRHAIPDEKETDKIFAELKSEMSKHGLKSKDMKKFIEYGWLYSSKTYHESDVSYKLNFRDGLQKAAGLGEYNEWYEMASEMAHSSPIFFYSNNIFFSDLTAVNLSDITIRSIKYFKNYVQEANISIEPSRLYLDILTNNLEIQVKKEDDSFYTKYKDFLVNDSDKDSDDQNED